MCPSGADGHAAAAGLAVRAAAALAGTGSGALGVGVGPAGQPVLTGGDPRVRISLSHGRGIAAAAVTMLGPVGVDVERIRPVDVAALARRWFTAAEAAWLGGLAAAERAEAFFGLWTQKEAIAKARGTGLRGGIGLRQQVRMAWRLPRAGEGTPLALVALDGEDDLAVAVAKTTDQVAVAVACAGPLLTGARVRFRVALPQPPGQR